jgi:sialate O-acetylesterase
MHSRHRMGWHGLEVGGAIVGCVAMHSPRLLAIACCLCSGAVLAAADAAKPLLHPLFSDEAVLQRDRPVTIWGWAAPGAEVSVGLAGEGLAAKPVSATAGPDGRWQAAIGPFQAGGPYVLSASAGETKAEAKDVLVGEVWLCSGQSNMEMVVRSSKDFETEKANADLPRLRHIAVQKNNAGTPQELITGQWKVSNAENVGGFTAAGYFMARTLLKDLQVPIGLVHSSWGGTAAEAWTSQEKLLTIPDFEKPVAAFRKLVADVEAQNATPGKDYNQLVSEWYKANDPGTSASPAWSDPAASTADWTAVTLPAALEDAKAIPADYDGTVWIRREVDIPAEDAGKKAAVKLGKIDDGDTTFVNSRVVGAVENPWWSRTYKVPANVLKAGRNVIAVRILDFGNKCAVIAKPEEMVLAIDGGASLPLAGAWQLHTGVELKAAASPFPARLDRSVGPTSLYNGMIAPLIPMTHAGVIWYQGEANAGRAGQYRTLLPTMIADWRERFGQGDLPFLIVSLANWQARRDQPGESGWAELREAQAITAQTIAKGGLAIAIDIGDAKDIHPKNKQEVGRRLALAAEAIAYGKDVVFSGPWYKAMAVEGSAIRLSFDHLGGGLVSADGQPLTGFAIAGEDRKWVWGEATIDGDSVVVSSPAVAKPVAVRYAWAENPACNLANAAGLPAVPFRTDGPKR